LEYFSLERLKEKRLKKLPGLDVLEVVGCIQNF
jgi:hypothetical protein